MKKSYCIDCKKELKYKAKRCIKCYREWIKMPENNNNFKHNKTHNNKCDCGKIIDIAAKKCSSCAKIGINNPNHKDGIYCIDHYCKCGNKISLNNFLYGNKRCRKCAGKELWENVKFKNKTLKASILGRLTKPNKLEFFLVNLLKKLNLNYKYVGDGKIILGGLCPDFIDKKNKKIIEFYGTYWHKLDSHIKNDKRRIKTYKKYGYKTLIIWEHELKNIDRVIHKIKRFINA